MDERSLAPVPRHSTRGGSWELASISQNPNPRDKEPPSRLHTHPFIPFVIFQHSRPFLELLFASWCCSALLRNHLGRGLSLKVLDNLSLVHRTLPPSLPRTNLEFFFFLKERSSRSRSRVRQHNAQCEK